MVGCGSELPPLFPGKYEVTLDLTTTTDPLVDPDTFVVIWYIDYDNDSGKYTLTAGSTVLSGAESKNIIYFVKNVIDDHVCFWNTSLSVVVDPVGGGGFDGTATQAYVFCSFYDGINPPQLTDWTTIYSLKGKYLEGF